MGKKTTVDVVKLVEEYIGESNWLVRENANTNKTFTGLFHYVAQEAMKKYSQIVYESEASFHENGWIHLHDLPFAAWIGYCAGWSMQKLFKIGLVTHTIRARPAKHLDSAVDHVANFLMSSQHEWAGAQAFSGVDLYLGAFVSADCLVRDVKRVEQQVQRLVYNLNFPSRIGAQTPFTNFTILLDTVKTTLDDEAYVGGKAIGKLGDFVDEAIIVSKALIRVLEEGDAAGQPFTFPIPTVMITDRFDWSGRRWGDLTYEIFKLTATKGSFYFLNAQSGAFDPDMAYAMCCRLTIDKTKLLLMNGGGLLSLPLKDVDSVSTRHLGGVWSIPDETGSIGVATLNMPRIGFEARGNINLLHDLLDYYMDVARAHLMNKRRRLEKILKNKPIELPITRTYLGTYSYHYNTIGVLGLPEFAANFIGDPQLWIELNRSSIRDAINVMKEALEYMHKKVREFEAEDHVMYNIEEVPGEGASYRLALLDYRMYRKFVELGEFFIPIVGGEPFYSNSIIPYYADLPLPKRIELEAQVQHLFTGGVMMHMHMYEAMDPEALMKMVYNISKSYKIVYFSITPAITVCIKCGWSSPGIFSECPKCGSEEVDWWSRIVGYYRPIKNWNPGKKAEFASRIGYGSRGRIRLGELSKRMNLLD